MDYLLLLQTFLSSHLMDILLSTDHGRSYEWYEQHLFIYKFIYSNMGNFHPLYAFMVVFWCMPSRVNTLRSFVFFWDIFDGVGFESTAKTSEALRVLLHNLDRNETRGGQD